MADEVEAALRAQASGFEVIRNGDAVLARTSLGRPSRVLLAGDIAALLASQRELTGHAVTLDDLVVATMSETGDAR